VAKIGNGGRRVLATWVLASALTATAGTGGDGAEITLLTHARVITVDAATPYAEAMAFDATGAILALGGADALAARFPDAKRLDVGGRVVVPGLIDAHAHLLGLGLALDQADLVGAASKREVIERLRVFEKTLPDDAWLTGRGWDQNDWPESERGFPSAADLDAAFPKRPVWLERVDGHAGWANSAALAKVERDLSGDWQPDGGRIERAEGEPTGVFVDAAMGLIDAVVPARTEAQLERALVTAMGAAARHGLTGVHDAGTPAATLDLMRALADGGRMPIRVYAMADGDSAALARLCRDGAYRHAGGRLQMRAVKFYADGALGSRGAVLLEDYADDPGNRGLYVTPEQGIESAAARAKRCGLQVATHAIGDRGNRMVLDVYGRVLGAEAAGDHRWRIEHAQIVALADIPRFRTLGLIASVQPTHATSDMPWAEARVGARRIVGAYAWRHFRDADVRLALGSDFPVEHVNPMLGLHAAVTRQDVAGKPVAGWYPNERLTPYEALRGFTLDAAYAGFDEDRIGSLSVGKRADFVVLSDDPVSAAPAALPNISVIATYVDGKAVYGKPR
jgi:predicted amidohydrolase YtcJ